MQESIYIALERGERPACWWLQARMASSQPEILVVRCPTSYVAEEQDSAALVTALFALAMASWFAVFQHHTCATYLFFGVNLDAANAGGGWQLGLGKFPLALGEDAAEVSRQWQRWQLLWRWLKRHGRRRQRQLCLGRQLLCSTATTGSYLLLHDLQLGSLLIGFFFRLAETQRETQKKCGGSDLSPGISCFIRLQRSSF